MSRRNKLGPVSFEHWPNSEGEALSAVVLAALLQTGIRGHFCATTCLTGTGLCIDATDTPSTAQAHLQPKYCYCYTLTLFILAVPANQSTWMLSSSISHLHYRHTRSTRDIQAITTKSNWLFIGLLESKGDKTLKLKPNSPPRPHSVQWCWHTADLRWVAERDCLKYQNAAKWGKRWISWGPGDTRNLYECLNVSPTMSHL